MVPNKVRELVEKFELHKESYRSASYNETQLRREFLDPLFGELGWDIDNKQGYAEAYKDVIHEDAIKIGALTKAPDYCFRVGGVRKFFVEAKKPFENLDDSKKHAFQLKRYAWSAKLPISILTDFEEFVIYDTRNRPFLSDLATKHRVAYFKYTDFIDKWDEIASVFSRDAILKGAFDKYAEDTKSKKGTSEVDSEFLKEIERWRELLAKDLAKNNPELLTRELNYSVQKTIDRIIFLRISEDRGIENYGRLMALLNRSGVYKSLCELFEEADQKYNSGLFHFQQEKDINESPDTLTLKLNISDVAIKEIIRDLYYPNSPYEFSVLPADTLGHVYEQFLGKVIRLTDEHRAVVEDKPEVKKAGGVYYTPTYIVDYIVKNTVGKLIEGKTPKQVEKIKILDPACGSGTFLLQAYQYLLDWHRDFYTANLNDKLYKGKNPVIFQIDSGYWRLTTSEKRRILLNNIFGVDIDAQAVEVTKLSLLLKVLEGESQQTLLKQLKLFHERALPDLGRNIKCGNSLVAPDIYLSHQLDLFDEESKFKLNTFDWRSEFKTIFENGGFNVVIGNPPWGADLSEYELEYLKDKNRKIIVRMIDTFMYFVYQSLLKLHTDGYFGMILPDVVLYQKDNQKLREYMVNEFNLEVAINMGNVFKNVNRPSAILIVNNKSGSKSAKLGDYSSVKKEDKEKELHNNSGLKEFQINQISKFPGSLFTLSTLLGSSIWEKVNSIKHTSLNDLVDEDGIQRGVSPDLKEAFIVSDDIVKKHSLEKEVLKAVLTGGQHVKRYYVLHPKLWLIYGTNSQNISQYTNIKRYIDSFKNDITCKEVKLGKHSLYSLHRARNENIFLKSTKLLGVITSDKLIISKDIEQTYATDGLFLFALKDNNHTNYILGVLNSKLLVYLYRLISSEKGRLLAQVKPTLLKNIPIPTCTDGFQKDRYERIVGYVSTIEDVNRKMFNAHTEQEKNVLKRQLETFEEAINKTVYELYNLNGEEIKIVEEK